MDVDWSLYLSDPDSAASELARMLHRGELALLLGAGVSRGLGIPTWHTLARVMAREAGLNKVPKISGQGINRKKKNGSDLGEIFRKIERLDKSGFKAKVKKWLYFRWRERRGNWASHNLVALGSLISGTARGRVENVLTLNFDSLLETYLRLYGFIAQPITAYPQLLKRADVHIFHSHGYLPFDAEDGIETMDIVLSSQAYFEALGDPQHTTWKMMDYVFAHKRILAVGTSGDDTPSRAVLANLAKTNAHDGLLELRDSKIAAVRLQSYADLPEFLFSIARKAALLLKAP